MDNKLLLQDAVSKVSEIDYESDNVLKQQRLGAIAINELVVRFSKNKSVDDYELLALVLVRFKDLQVRDYAMGLATVLSAITGNSFRYCSQISYSWLLC